MSQLANETYYNSILLSKIENLSCIEKVEIYSSLLSNNLITAPSSDVKNELIALLNEINEARKEAEESHEQLESIQDKIEFKKISEFNLNKQNELLENKIEKEENKLKENNKILEKVNKYNQVKAQVHEQNLKHQTYESRMKVLHNDTKILEEISINKQLLIDSTTNYANRINSNENYLLKKYSIIELLTGIKVYENNMTDQSSWFQIFFANIPDHCLDSEWLKSEEMQNKLKNIVAQLSGELQDKYRSMFKKRKMNNQADKSFINVNNLNDFKIIYDNYLLLLCLSMTKEEIDQAKKQFAIDWVDGSSSVTILINSKSSKMASVLIPKFYPFSGTSQIKLLSITGFESALIKKFQVEENLGSFNAWIAKLTEWCNENSTSQ